MKVLDHVMHAHIEHVEAALQQYTVLYKTSGGGM